MNRLIICLIFLVSQSVSAKEIDKIKWLSGAWINNLDGKQVVLTLSRQHKNRIIGAETVIKNNNKGHKIQFFEHFEISGSKLLKLKVFPKNQKPLVMKATLVTARKLVFENPQHSFPKYWSFELMKDGSLIELAKNEKTKIKVKFDRN